MGVAAARGLLRGLWLVVIATQIWAAPKLRLTQTVDGPVSVAAGANGPTRTIEAFNAGDGLLNLAVSSAVPWVAPSVGAARNCTLRPGTCLPINMSLQTASLARGTHTGTVTVRDPNANDAPQTIQVLVQVGGGVPDRLDFFAAPNGSADDAVISANSLLNGAVSTTGGGGTWLSFTLDGSGSFRFVLPYRVVARHLGGMAEGTYNGSLAITGSAFAADNKAVPVAFRVTSQPIASVNPRSVLFRIPQNTRRQQQNLVVINRGLGALSIVGVNASTFSGSNWLSAERLAGFDVIALTADPGSLGPGTYLGSVAVNTNGVNGPQTVPVQLEVTPQSAPIAAFQGVVNNATFEAGDQLAPGTIAAVFGEQFTYGAPQQAAVLPLETTFGGVRVLVNDRPAPVYYVSYGQVNFQVPYETLAGEAVVRVEREGQRGNGVSVGIAAFAPRLLRLGIGDYGIVVNQDGTFPIPVTAGIPSRAARAGDALTIYALGLGATTPAVRSGEGSPVDPLAQVAPAPKVFFGAGPLSGGTTADPFFVGLTPFLVGLYQINVIVPRDTPRGPNVVLYIERNGVASNPVRIALE